MLDGSRVAGVPLHRTSSGSRLAARVESKHGCSGLQRKCASRELECIATSGKAPLQHAHSMRRAPQEQGRQQPHAHHRDDWVFLFAGASARRELSACGSQMGISSALSGTVGN